MRQVCLLALSELLLFAALAPAQGTLSSIRDDARNGSKSNDSKSDSNWSLSLSEDDGGLGEITGALLAAPFVLPRVITNDAGAAPQYDSWPYAHSRHGYLLVRDESSPQEVDLVPTLFGATCRSPNWAVRLSLDDGDDFDRINRFSGSLMATTQSRFGLATDWKGVFERLPNGGHDELVVSRSNLLYCFAQHERAQFYGGLGLRTMSGRGQTDVGGDFSYSFDWFPYKPIVLSGWVDAGWINRVGAFEAKFTVGAVRRGVEAYLGYGCLSIGGNNIQGPLAGIRFWF